MPTQPQARTSAFGPASGSDLPDIDTGVLDRLVHMIGPEATPEFVAGLVGDLRRVHAGIGMAVDGADPADLGRHIHALVGLAGAVGATRLLHLAQGLNRTANAGSVAAMADSLAAIRDEVVLLIAFVMAGNPVAAARP